MAEKKAHNGINQVMSLDIHRSPAQQQIERKQSGKQTLATPPCHNHQNGGHADMRAGKSRRRALTHLLRTLHQIIEETMFVSRPGKQLLIMVEIIADRRKYSSCYILLANGRKIKLWSCHRHEDIKQIINKEGSDYDKRDFLKKLKTIEEIPHHHQKDHRIVEEVTHIERFTDPHLREAQTEPYSRLSAEYPLLG